MLARSAIATVAIYVAWSGIDFLVHGRMLESTYLESQELWRLQEDMKMGLLQTVVFCSAALFVATYTMLIRPKRMQTGVIFGLLTGLSVGLSMGYGTYAVQPLPEKLPLVWLLATLVEFAVAGAIVAALVKDPPAVYDA